MRGKREKRRQESTHTLLTTRSSEKRPGDEPPFPFSPVRRGFDSTPNSAINKNLGGRKGGREKGRKGGKKRERKQQQNEFKRAETKKKRIPKQRQKKDLGSLQRKTTRRKYSCLYDSDNKEHFSDSHK